MDGKGKRRRLEGNSGNDEPRYVLSELEDHEKLDEDEDGMLEWATNNTVEWTKFLKMTKFFVENGASASSSPRNPEYNPLGVAVRNGNEDVVDFLLERGASPDDGLAAAVACGMLHIVQKLLKHGARPRSTVLRHPLSIAASSKKFHAAAIAEALLLASGETPDVVNSRDYAHKGRTALMSAVVANNVATIKVLLAHGADTLLSDINCFTCLHYCARDLIVDDQIVFLLVNGTPATKRSVLLESADRSGCTAMDAAVMISWSSATIVALARLGAKVTKAHVLHVASNDMGDRGRALSWLLVSCEALDLETIKTALVQCTGPNEAEFLYFYLLDTMEHKQKVKHEVIESVYDNINDLGAAMVLAYYCGIRRVPKRLVSANDNNLYDVMQDFINEVDTIKGVLKQAMGADLASVVLQYTGIVLDLCQIGCSCGSYCTTIEERRSEKAFIYEDSDISE